MIQAPHGGGVQHTGWSGEHDPRGLTKGLRGSHEQGPAGLQAEKDFLSEEEGCCWSRTMDSSDLETSSLTTKVPVGLPCPIGGPLLSALVI